MAERPGPETTVPEWRERLVCVDMVGRRTRTAAGWGNAELNTNRRTRFVEYLPQETLSLPRYSCVPEP